MPKTPNVIDPIAIVPDMKSAYPEAFQRAVSGRGKRRLAALAGLTNLSAVHVELAPGSASSLRVWHSHEDELILVVSGQATVITDGREQIVDAGQLIGFPAGEANGHQIVNCGASPLVFIEIASFSDDNISTYPDVDLLQVPDGRARRFVRRDGTPY
nr:cupin domain-containing protein [uncultured Shinella sp.]